MTSLYITGLLLCGVSIIGGSMIISSWITAKSNSDRANIEHRFEDRIQTSKREAEAWRRMYEDMRAERDALQVKADLQTAILKKTKVKDIEK